MSLHLYLRNDTNYKYLFRRDLLQQIGSRICRGEGVTGRLEVSLLFCNDAFIAELNRQYRSKSGPTDVLSFSQLDDKAGGDLPDGAQSLGDIVISLDTVVKRCAGDPDRARAEVRLLFCHGLLHLLGYDHGSAAERKVMTAKQAEYLRIPLADAWIAERHATA